ncbi:hypothetical protein H4R21_002234 [Coemansia helicoidea]|uniref:Uncharacterized protein n=1 Tax=Coemansia helicoidea TaxID=1286919 RepID=A0ACC1L8C8_9FUNG|nr:hypothetical protein H4R21_002234 [Coemansia helicoidea]
MEVEAVRKEYNIPHPDDDGGQLEGQSSDEDRANFNSIKHVRDSYREHLITALPLLLLAGWFYPKTSATLGFIYFLACDAYKWCCTHHKPEASKYCMHFMRSILFGWAVLAMHGAAMVTIFA